MHSRKLLELLLVGLSAMTIAEATFVDSFRLAANNGAIQRRQEDDELSAASTSAPSTSPPPTTKPSSTSTSTSTSQTSSPSATNPSSSPSKTSSSTPTAPPTTSDPPKTTEPPKTEPSQSEIIETITSVITSTNSDGSPTLVTTHLTSTQTPGLAGGNGSQPSGMSKQTRDTVIGVVVGVGGAIVLGGLAFVAWRIWGRKKGPEENDGLMEYGSSAGDKPESGGSMTGRTPFQSTLESYHAPTQVNTASNF